MGIAAFYCHFSFYSGGGQCARRILREVCNCLSRWDTWARLIAPHTSRFAWAVIEGNHELEVRQHLPASACMMLNLRYALLRPMLSGPSWKPCS
jgi:hypothetical protein